MTFLRLIKGFACLVVMDLILKFQILKKFERNSKSKTQKNTENPAQAKFSSIMNLLNGFVLDGIIGNYKQAELPLMHQNLENIQN